MSRSFVHQEWRNLRFRLGRLRAERDLTCQTQNGLLTFSSKDNDLSRRLFVRSQWQVPFAMDCLELLCENGLLVTEGNHTLVNAGSNIGAILTLLMQSRRFQAALAFEPEPKNFSYLERNVRQNAIEDQVTLFQLGLSNRNASAELELSSDNCGDHRVREVGDAPGAYGEADRSTAAIELRTLDSILEERGITPEELSLFWVDIQGHEGQFFAGASKALSGRAPVITEFWPYGIERSCFGKDATCSLLEELFTGYYRRERKRWSFHPIGEARKMYDQLIPQHRFVDVIFLPPQAAERIRENSQVL